MDSGKIKGALIFIGSLILASLLFFGFLLFVLVFVALALIIFLGFYVYLRIKLWRVRRHPPKILERPGDYL
jgi:uncharacterized protein (DUF58 family)